MTILSESTNTFNIIAIVISMLAGICLVVVKSTEKKNETKAIANSDETQSKSNPKTSLVEAITNLKNKYINCSNDQLDEFDSELRRILLTAEQEGEQLTIDIENIILQCLISMNRANEAMSQFNSMTSSFTPNQLTYVLMLELLINDFNAHRDSILFCISQFDKLSKVECVEFKGTHGQYSVLTRAYCILGNYAEAMLYYDKIPLRCPELRRSGIHSILPLLDANKKYKETLRVIYLLSEAERDSIALDYLIKTSIRLKEPIDSLEQLFTTYQKVLSTESTDMLLEHIARTSSESKALLIFSSQLKPSLNSYGIMMGLYSKKKDIDSTKHYFTQMLSSGYQPTLAHCQLMVKTLFQCSRVNAALAFFDSIHKEWALIPDKALYELMIKHCIEAKLELKAYEILIQTVNNNIKLEKYNYEEVLDALNASDLKEKGGLIHSLHKVIKMSNFKRDKKLMQKLKNMTELNGSISSNDTMASSGCFSR